MTMQLSVEVYNDCWQPKTGVVPDRGSSDISTNKAVPMRILMWETVSTKQSSFQNVYSMMLLVIMITVMMMIVITIFISVIADLLLPLLLHYHYHHHHHHLHHQLDNHSRWSG